MITLHIFGDSHVIALNEGMKLIESHLDNASIKIDFYSRHGLNWKQFSVKRTGTVFHCSAQHPSIEPMRYTVDKPDDIYIFSSPFHSAPACRNPAWREFCPWQSVEAHPGLHAVSDLMIENLAAQRIHKALKLLEQMKECDYMVLVAEAPKPLSRSPTIDKIFPDVMAGVDQVYRRHVSRKLTEIGVPIIYVPESTYSDGLTKDEYSATGPGKFHHGNAKFGAAMMGRILQVAAGITLN